MRRIKGTQNLSLGYAQGIPSYYSNKYKPSKLEHAPVGIPPFFFNNYQLVSVEPKFLLLHIMRAILGLSFYFVLLSVLIRCLDQKFLNKRDSSISYLFT